MWESNKYREDTYHLQKSFSKFVMDRSYFSLMFMWESNKYREDTYHLQKSFLKFVMDRQWRSQDFNLGGAKLKDKIESKINLNIINRC